MTGSRVLIYSLAADFQKYLGRLIMIGVAVVCHPLSVDHLPNDNVRDLRAVKDSRVSSMSSITSAPRDFQVS